MGEKDDGLGLGLSLSLRCPESSENPAPQPPKPPAFPLNLLPSHLPFMHQKNHSSFNNDPFLHSSSDKNAEPRSFLRGFDVNRPAECDEDLMVSSPNSTVSSVSGKRSERGEDHELDAGGPSSSLEEDGGDAAARKKLRLSKEQAAVLEETFKEHNTLNPKQKLALAKQLNLRARQVEVWFQNRRARTKLKQTEVDCEYLKHCCEKLTEENRRLQKEVNELRALKLSPQFYLNASPPTTLTMCPQCERVAISASSAPATSSAIAKDGSTNTCQANPATVHHHHHQPPMPMTSWAAIIPPQPLGGHRPRS